MTDIEKHIADQDARIKALEHLVLFMANLQIRNSPGPLDTLAYVKQ